MIKVIDAICGSGKSSAMFKKMGDNPDRRYMYITPFLSEIEERIPEELPDLFFKTPTNRGEGKIKDFMDLLRDGYNIAATHKLYSMFTSSIVDKIIEMDYCLIIDESIDCVGLLPEEYKPSDTQALLEGDFVVVDEGNRGQLLWNEGKYPEHDGRYSTIRNLCNLGMLYCYKNYFLMWELSPKLLCNLSEIYVLTYLFKGSDMKCWLDINGIPYEYVNHSDIGLLDERDIKRVIKDNLTILTNKSLGNTRQQVGTLSYTWFTKANSQSINKYRAMLRSCVVKEKAKSGEVFWTTYKGYASKLAGDGYRRGIKSEDKDCDNISFLPCNIRATNKYSDYWLCMYALNRYKNPIEVNYMRNNGATPDEDSYALGELIQFIFRGCIRKGEPMKVFILSKRMRLLLEEWLDE